MTYAPDILPELLRALVTIAGWYVLFYHRHKPAGSLRRVALLASFPAGYLVWRLIPLNSNAGNEIRWIAILLVFALLCGNLKESLFTAAYYIGMEACMDTVRNFLVRYTTGAGVVRFSPAYYLHMNLLYLAVLGWAIFYCMALKNRRGTLPLRFWIMTVIPPLGSMMLLTSFATAAQPLLAAGINIYRQGLLIVFFLIALNLLTFITYVRQLTFYESHVRAQILQGQMDVYARQIKSIEAGHERTEAVRHEMKNLLLVLQTAIAEQNYPEALSRLRQVVGELEAGALHHYTGVIVIDAMLSYKQERVLAAGASFAVHAPALDIPAGAAYDIAAMLAIMLDNAADAADAAAGGTDRFTIRCDIQQKGRIVFITFTNPLAAPLRRHKGEIVSAKPESGHGLGLPSLRRLAEKYGGNVQIEDADGVFSISVLLSVP